jgi:hypothetical protein
VYDFRVSCARACADSLGRLDHHDFTSREGEGAGAEDEDDDVQVERMEGIAQGVQLKSFSPFVFREE